MAPILFFFNVTVAFVYARLIYWIMSGWDDTKEWDINEDYIPRTPITVIVAARNEEKYIRLLIKSLLDQNYPEHLLQIIIVDDQSTDATRSIANEYESARIKLLTTEKYKEGKKAAIGLAMKNVTTDIVICTDADCTPPPNWLRLMVSFYEVDKPKFIAGTIVYSSDKSLLQRFQYLDGVANMAITANGIHTKKYYMANGANMLFEKSLFEDLGGYENDKVASGDDMMLIQKTALLYPEKIRFLKNKEAAVKTAPAESIKQLVAQRKRWATKSKHYADKGIIKVQGFVFFVILVLLFDLILIPFTGGFSFYCFLFLLFIKLMMDFLFLKKMARYFNNIEPISSFLPASVWFVIYILWAAVSALMPSAYIWKGREVE